VVPESLERDETLSGPPRATPEPTSISGYRGHYFDLERGSGNRIAFHTAGNTPLLVNLNIPQFELVGTRLNDASEEIGPLFGERPPKIHTIGHQAWRDIDCIVIIEEGKRAGDKQWRDVVAPDQTSRNLILERNLKSERRDGTPSEFMARNWDPPWRV
jgi:hypothetical protein